MNPKHLILFARVRMLRRSLIEVKCALESVETLRGPRRQLPKLASKSKSALNDIKYQVGKIEILAGDAKNAELQQWVDSIKASIQVIEGNMVAVGMVTTSQPLKQKIAGSLKEKYLDKVEGKLGEVDELLKDLQKPVPALPKAWRDTATVFAGSHQIFADHVDLLTGLALRDTGFDDGLPKLADDVIGKVMNSWNSLTIPTHRHGGQPAMAELVHLDFPEWSLWALPLAAFELGRFELRSNRALEELVESKEKAFADVKVCMADAIATYLMGPAYGWASITIRFDPAGAADEVATWTRRLKAIAATLRDMDEYGSDEKTYDGIATQLEAAWTSALGEAGATAAAAAAEDIDPDLGSWIQAIRPIRPRRLFEADWETVLTAVDTIRQLMKDENAQIEPAKDARHVLNAAWLVRIWDGYDQAMDETLDGLSKRGMELLKSVPPPDEKQVVGGALAHLGGRT
jgi:hypothetical protein